MIAKIIYASKYNSITLLCAWNIVSQLHFNKIQILEEKSLYLWFSGGFGWDRSSLRKSAPKWKYFLKHPCHIKIYTKINMFSGDDVAFCKVPNMKQVNKSRNG